MRTDGSLSGKGIWVLVSAVEGGEVELTYWQVVSWGSGGEAGCIVEEAGCQ